MGWWFGRKSAPADARPFVPAWASLGLSNHSVKEGVARSVEGMSVYVKSDALFATLRSGTWEMGLVRGSSVVISDQQMVGPRLPPIASATGGSTVDVEARAVINAMLGAMRQHGLIAV